MNRYLLTVITALSLLAIFASCAKDEGPTGPSNYAPAIDSVYAEPDSLRPGGTVLLTCIASDADNDTLSYSWIRQAGSFTTADTAATVTWAAPQSVGVFRFTVTVDDGLAETLDSVQVWVYLVPTVQITAPVDGFRTTPDDTVAFTGQVGGFFPGAAGSTVVEWRSNRDGVLNDSPPDSLGALSFSTTLSYDLHEIILAVTVGDTSTASDTITVDATIPPALLLYEIERGYTFNRLTWSLPDSSEAEPFDYYQVIRTPYWEQAYDDTITVFADTTFTDSSVIIGETYTYQVHYHNSFGSFSESNTASIQSGVFTETESRIGGMIYGDDYYYLFVTEVDSNQVKVIDVTANNIDYRIAVGDSAFGLAFSSNRNELYVANSGDTTISVIDLNTMEVERTINVAPARPLFLAYQESEQLLYMTPRTNDRPYIFDVQGDSILGRIDDSRLIVDSSIVLINSTFLYVSEIGGYPASVFKYDISNLILGPQLALEDTHNTMGYNLRDMTLSPDGSLLLLACESPYYVQIFDASTFELVSQLNSGAYPNAVAVSPDGERYYTANRGEQVHVFDTGGVNLASYRFAGTVLRGGVRISPDSGDPVFTGHFLTVLTYDAVDDVSRISIVHIP